MLLQWFWIPLGALALLVIYQQFRINRIHRASKKQDELFRIVTENAADMIALVDVKGRRLYNSPAYKRILGYSAAELGETSAFEQIHPDDRLRVLEGAREARETGIGKQLEYRTKHKDGSWRVLESLASTVRNAAGRSRQAGHREPRHYRAQANRTTTRAQSVPRSADWPSESPPSSGPPAKRLRAHAARRRTSLCAAARQSRPLQGHQRNHGNSRRRSGADRNRPPHRRLP